MSAPDTAPAVERSLSVPAIKPPGLKAAFHIVIEHLGDHLLLLRVETAKELSRLGAVLGYWAALALLVQIALLLGMALLVASLWGTAYQWPAALGCVVLLMGLGVYCLAKLRMLSKQASVRFMASSEQLRCDLKLVRELIGE